MLPSPFRLTLRFLLEPFLLGCRLGPEASLSGDSFILRRVKARMVLALFWRLASIALHVTIVAVFRKPGIRVEFFLAEFAGERWSLFCRSWCRHARVGWPWHC